MIYNDQPHTGSVLADYDIDIKGSLSDVIARRRSIQESWRINRGGRQR